MPADHNIDLKGFFRLQFIVRGVDIKGWEQGFRVIDILKYAVAVTRSLEEFTIVATYVTRFQDGEGLPTSS